MSAALLLSRWRILLAWLRQVIGQRIIFAVSVKHCKWGANMIRTAFHLCVSIAIVLGPLPICAQTDLDRATLAGLNGVYPLLRFTFNGTMVGLNETSLQTLLELRLRAAGILVLTKDQMLEAPGYPELDLSIIILPDKTVGGTLRGYAYAIRLELLQWISLRRTPIDHASGSTWDTSIFLGKSTIDGSPSHIRDVVTELVDRFANDYLTMNPRR